MPKRLSAIDYCTDKSENPHYLRDYEALFADIASKEVRLLELGVDKGGSLLMWRDFFERGTIVGLDLNPAEVDDPTGRIHTYRGRQEDTDLLSRIAREQAPDGFDIIIDDCSHIGELTRTSFWHLFQHHLKPGGIYAIEDWGTGYWGWYADGRDYRPAMPGPLAGLASRLRKAAGNVAERAWVQRVPRLSPFLRRHTYKRRLASHDYGMVGLVKQLVDECGMGDITHPRFGKGIHAPSRIGRMQISHGHVIVLKAKPE